jgi:4-hydroxybenzoate polyprenyltransferase
VATGAIGVAAEVLPPVLGGAYVLCGVLLLVWLIGIGFVLWTLGAQTLRNRRLRSIPAEAIEPAQP